MKRSSLTSLLGVVLYTGVSFAVHADVLANDHLVPVRAFFRDTHGVGAAYRKLWQEKLLMTPGELARYVYLPAPTNTEEAVSVYQSAGAAPGSPSAYRITVTEASSALWDCISSGSEEMTGRKVVDPASISIRRCDAPLPDSTALAVHKVWVKMLLQIRPQSSEAMSLDGSTEIFSAKDSSGKELEGQIPVEPKQNTAALLDLANLLVDYCELPASERPQMAAKVEKAAQDLLRRVSRKRSSK